MSMEEGGLYTVTAPALLKYAWASGDYNSIHFNEDHAKARGLPGLIMHGMFILGLINKKVDDFVESKNLSVKKIDCRFQTMAFVGDALSFRIEEHLDQNKIHISVLRDNAGQVAVATAKVFFK